MSDKPTVIIEQVPVFEPVQYGLAGFKTIIHISDLPDIPFDPKVNEKIIELLERDIKRIFEDIGIKSE